MLTPRTPHVAPGRASTSFAGGRASLFRRRHAAPLAVGQAHRPWSRSLRLAFAAGVVTVLFVVGSTLRVLPAGEGAQPALSSWIPRREAIDAGERGVATSDYEAATLRAAPSPHAAAAAQPDDASVSVYTCAPGPPVAGFSWTLAPSGALRNGDACVAFGVDGDAALALVPCDSPLVLAFSPRKSPGSQLAAALSAASGELAGLFCLDTGDANTQGAPLLLQPCVEVQEGPVRTASQRACGTPSH